MQISKVIGIKCILFTGICRKCIAIYHPIGFFKTLNLMVILTSDNTSSIERVECIQMGTKYRPIKYRVFMKIHRACRMHSEGD